MLNKSPLADKITFSQKLPKATSLYHWALDGYLDKDILDIQTSTGHDFLYEYQRWFHLFIGLATLYQGNQDIGHYPVYYNLRNGKTYLGAVIAPFQDPITSKPNPGFTLQHRAFRTSTEQPITYCLYNASQDLVTKLGKGDAPISLSTLAVAKGYSKLPCKILAYLYTGFATSDGVDTSALTLSDTAPLLVACGNRIILTNPAELSKTWYQNRIDIILDSIKGHKSIEVVSLGNYNQNTEPWRLSYIPDRGIACNHNGIAHLYMQGTDDMTPNIVYNARDVRFGNRELLGGIRTTAMSCYTELDLRDAQLDVRDISWSNSWLFCANLDRLILPTHYTELPGVMSFFRSLYPSELVIPAKLEVPIQLARFPRLKRLYCPLQMLGKLAPKGVLSHFPALESLNNHPAEEYCQFLAGTLLLSGYTSIEIGSRDSF